MPLYVITQIKNSNTIILDIYSSIFGKKYIVIIPISTKYEYKKIIQIYETIDKMQIDFSVKEKFPNYNKN